MRFQSAINLEEMLNLEADYSFFHSLQTLRRLAQNREAAKKSRLRKKVGTNFSLQN